MENAFLFMSYMKISSKEIHDLGMKRQNLRAFSKNKDYMTSEQGKISHTRRKRN